MSTFERLSAFTVPVLSFTIVPLFSTSPVPDNSPLLETSPVSPTSNLPSISREPVCLMSSVPLLFNDAPSEIVSFVSSGTVTVVPSGTTKSTPSFNVISSFNFVSLSALITELYFLSPSSVVSSDFAFASFAASESEP